MLDNVKLIIFANDITKNINSLKSKPIKPMATQFININSYTYLHDDDVYEAIECGEYIVLTTHNGGYTYVLEYSPAHRTFNIISTDNPRLSPTQ